ncbi:hypothetical protein AO1008_03955 [Aspergillus oryzae 100-8]|uniref:Uncharacterized protein n=1 Tax=Aspergillus oryzae (strain 3.042) TaxID=1160506 RepID=I8TJT8_ASPO3|nr:hypothetical protein Ao3042_09546 [Aspergillus oryzae 3.042]KDE77960.1 hypothetical protein AO1008_03955 [Aspergillus oryzae 100-8]|eukprot:EIT74330.1 hypothetical protein Ao3042_09546 [Aspergillus oryzae 3.042]
MYIVGCVSTNKNPLSKRNVSIPEVVPATGWTYINEYTSAKPYDKTIYHPSGQRQISDLGAAAVHRTSVFSGYRDCPGRRKVLGVIKDILSESGLLYVLQDGVRNCRVPCLSSKHSQTMAATNAAQGAFQLYCWAGLNPTSGTAVAIDKITSSLGKGIVPYPIWSLPVP